MERDGDICGICTRKSFDDGEDIESDICPFCEKNVLEYGEERCKSCLIKLKSVANNEENI